MKVKQLSAVLALCTASYLASAESYQGEVLAAYSDVNEFTDLINLGVHYHFSAVNTESYPLAEAAFLEKSNNMGLIYTRSESEYVDYDYTVAKLEFYIPNAWLYIAPFYSYESSHYSDKIIFVGPVDRTPSFNDWGADVGVTPIDGLRISTTWSDEFDYELNFEAKYVVGLSDKNALNLELEFRESPDDSDGDDYIAAAVDYYFDRTFSMGLELADSGLPSDDIGYGIRTEKFFGEQFRVSARYFQFKSDRVDVDIWTIGAAFRF